MSKYEELTRDLKYSDDKELKIKVLKEIFSCEDISNDEVNKFILNYSIHYVIHVSDLKDLLEDLSIKEIMLYRIDPLTTLMSSINIDNNEEIIEFIKKLLVSDLGVFRLLGRKLLYQYKLTIDQLNPLADDAEYQVRFIVSLTQDYTNVEVIGPLLIGLFNSPFNEVRNVLINLLPDLIFNYFGYFKDLLKQSILIESEELKLFQTFMMNVEEQFNLRHNCIELMPEYMYPHEYEIAQNKANEHLQDLMTEIKKNSISPIQALFKKVTLGRGGGFRNKNGQVQQLTKISASVMTPMFISSLTPWEQHLQMCKILENWNIKHKCNE